jgi:hypothetical protein
MAQIKNGEILPALQALHELAAVALPVAGAFKVARLVRQIEAMHADVEKVRMGLVETYADRGADGKVAADASGQVAFADADRFSAFKAEYERLMMIESASPGVLTFADFGSASLAPSVLLRLGPLLDNA